MKPGELSGDLKSGKYFSEIYSDDSAIIFLAKTIIEIDKVLSSKLTPI